VKDDKRASRLTGNQCHCRSCGEYFTTVGNFDRHLRGSGYPECLSPESVGLVRDAFGYWQSPPPKMPIFTSMKREEAAQMGMKDS
jgi:hypothetical protein